MPGFVKNGRKLTELPATVRLPHSWEYDRNISADCGIRRKNKDGKLSGNVIGFNRKKSKEKIKLGNGLGSMKKLQIGIYSTEPAWLENSREILEHYEENLKNNIEIHSFQNASEMWGG